MEVYSQNGSEKYVAVYHTIFYLLYCEKICWEYEMDLDTQGTFMGGVSQKHTF
jgi:hypothetical protein